MIPIRTARAITLAAAIALPTSAALAQEPVEAGTFGKWTAYHYKTKKGPVCYIVSRPVESTASRKNIKRDQAFFIVTNRPGAKVRGEVNAIIGYTFKKGVPAKLRIDNTSFTLFTTGDGAWSEGPAVDRKIVAAMKRGKTMSVAGVSSRGTKTLDTYDLTGVTAAIKAIDGLCKRK
jgi:invasion protein IalB